MKTAFLHPCLCKTFQPEISKSCLELLFCAGFEVVIPKGQGCCGQVPYKQGLKKEAAGLAERYIRMFSGFDAVISPSASCVKTIREYPAFFTDRPDLREKAIALAGKSFEFCEFMLKNAPNLSLKLAHPLKAALHESCQLKQAGVSARPRDFLAGISGLSLVLPESPAPCCGFGGSFLMDFPHLSERLADAKLDELLDLHPDLIVVSEPGCLLNLASRLERRNTRVQAVYIACLPGLEVVS